MARLTKNKSAVIRKRENERYAHALQQVLVVLGAQPVLNELGTFRLHSVGGDLDVKIKTASHYEGADAECWFHDIRRARKIIGGIHRSSGKWNHHYHYRPLDEAVKEFQETLKKILPLTPPQQVIAAAEKIGTVAVKSDLLFRPLVTVTKELETIGKKLPTMNAHETKEASLRLLDVAKALLAPITFKKTKQTNRTE